LNSPDSNSRAGAGRIDSRFYSVVVGAPPLPKEVAEIKDLDDVSFDEESSEEEDSGRPVGKRAFEENEEKKQVEVVMLKEDKPEAVEVNEDKKLADAVEKKREKAEADKETASIKSMTRKKDYDHSMSVASLEDNPELKKAQLTSRLERMEVEKALSRQASKDELKQRPDSADDPKDGISPLVQTGQSSSGSIDFGLGLNVKASLVINPDLFAYFGAL
jgi:hypothetical protein